MRIQYTLLLWFTALVAVVAVAGFLAVHESERALSEAIGKESQSSVVDIMQIIDRELYHIVIDVRVLHRDRFLQDALNESTAFLESVDAQRYIDEQDLAWRMADEQTPFMRDILLSDASFSLREFTDLYDAQRGYSVFGEIFVTNRFGSNVAQTGRTSDYKQDDEEWWQQAKEYGVYIGDVEYDESAAIYSVPVAVRVDDYNGNFHGVSKAVVNVEELVTILRDVKSRGGHDDSAFKLVDTKGRIIHDSSGVLSPGEFDEMCAQILEERGYFSKNGKLISHAASTGYGEFAGTGWRLVVFHDEEALLAPVAKMKSELLILVALSILLTISGGVVSTLSISRPIEELAETVKSSSSGQLAISDTLKNTPNEVGNLAQEFEKLHERTRQSFSDLEREKKKSEHLLKFKMNVLSQLSHDLRSPLTPLVTLVPLIRPNDDVSREHLSVVQRNVTLLKNISDDMQILTSREPTLLQNVNISDIVRHAAAASQKEVGKDIDVTLDCDDLRATANEDHVREVLTILRRNAVKFMPRGGKLTFRVKKDGEMVRVSVQDTGVGVEREQLSSIFTEFFKVDESRHDLDETGLRLPICRKLVKRMGGAIWAESDGIGKGTTISFTLPAA